MWYWYLIVFVIGLLLGLGISRYFDKKLDAIQAKLEELINKAK